jgi:hypothetical protein
MPQAPIDSRLSEIGQVFGSIGEVMSRLASKAERPKEAPSISTEEVQRRVINSSQEFLKELDVRAARGFLMEVESSALLRSGGEHGPIPMVSPTVTVTVTITITITIKAKPPVESEQIVRADPNVG